LAKWLNKIICGDCLAVLSKLPDNSIDLIVTDPPYYNQGTCPTYKYGNRKKVVTDQGEWDHFENEGEYLKFMRRVIKELCRVLKKNGSLYIFISDRYISYIRAYLRAEPNMSYASSIVWAKTNAPPRLIYKAGFISSKEMFCFAYKGDNPVFHKPKLFKELLDVWFYPQTPKGERVGHPTQKPLSIIQKIVKCSSNPGDLVLDCFFGSGTVAVACRMLGRNFIGLEISPEYCQIARKRLSAISNIDCWI
jgi:DNA modification methylase